MKVQIYGARMSSSFLYILLRDHLKVKITDGRSKPQCECAWEILYNENRRFYSMIGVDLTVTS